MTRDVPLGGCEFQAPNLIGNSSKKLESVIWEIWRLEASNCIPFGLVAFR